MPRVSVAGPVEKATATFPPVACARWALALLLLAAAPAHALRCGSDLVSEGDYAYEVRRKCGEPAAVNGWIAYRVIRLTPREAPVREEVVVPVAVEEWIYDFGPHRLVRILRFEDGRLIRIATAGYGRR